MIVDAVVFAAASLLLLPLEIQQWSDVVVFCLVVVHVGGGVDG